MDVRVYTEAELGGMKKEEGIQGLAGKAEPILGGTSGPERGREEEAGCIPAF